MDKEINTKINSNEKNKSVIWTQDEDRILLEKAKLYNNRKWKLISKFFISKNAVQCQSRFKQIKPGIKRGSWVKEEDKNLIKLVDKYGKNWSKLSKLIKNRTSKQIRDRYLNILDPEINKAKFSEEEDRLIITLYKENGAIWSKMSKNFKGRTGEMIKNRFYSVLKKKYINDDQITKKEDNKFVERNDNLNKPSNEKILLNNSFHIIKVETNKINFLYEDFHNIQSSIDKNFNILNSNLVCVNSKIEEYKKLKHVNNFLL